jgi:hypothetical protein
MNATEFTSMFNSIAAATKRFPNCRIANCECDSKHHKWKKGCFCMCHFFTMDALHGKDKWTLDDMSKQAEKGLNGLPKDKQG